MRKTIFRRRRVAAHPLARGRLTGLIEDPLTWDIQVRGDLAIVVVDGELDFSSAPGLRDQLGPAADAGRHLILDLAGVRFCDCAGLSLFLRLQQRTAAAGGSLHLAAVSASVRRVITGTRLSDVFPVTASVADAIALLGGEAVRPGSAGAVSPVSRRVLRWNRVPGDGA
jgi:anti-sigma B factor antagonist